MLLEKIGILIFIYLLITFKITILVVIINAIRTGWYWIHCSPIWIS
ncbi:hypothetical protein H1P_6390006 [Hyella patelloides LEGE 07179]|uniref:Uncharacterized protein n=1 Tax=Hyella patelloides LEGE 07179 TaxID=945734 RepID=A0A563W238_9CYAN|nr:hypothetical protein H1P_6390006 [Hyella patelloides LEGE 07179]